jgi:6-phosphogluconolactonase
MTQIDDEVVRDDAEALARHVASWLFERANDAPGPQFTVALSGGSTPKRLYEILATEYRTSFPWDRTHLFFGDERFVPATDADSNQRMVREALIAHIDLPDGNFHPMPTAGDAAEAASIYQGELAAHYRNDALEMERPLFDVVLLGLGDNGHTASLFPGTEVLENLLDWVAPCVPHDAPHTRLTLTYPAIASSRDVAFLIAGAGKRDALARVRANDRTQPASRITSIGRVTWFLDKAAAA